MSSKRKSREADPAENGDVVEVEIKEDADLPSDDENSGQLSQDGFVVQNGATKGIRTGIVYDERVLKHINAKPGSPETAERVQVCFEKLKRTKLLDQCELIAGEEASDEILTLAHKAEYVRKVRNKCSKLTGRETVEIDQDVVLSRESDRAARVAVGGLVKLTDKVLNGELDNGFAIVRPPGHHAEAGEAMGYCIYNNIAVAARYAISKGVKRVLIVDWDLHHGNGIQNIFLNDDKVMYFSVHYHGRGDYYPGESGALHVVGNDDGYGQR
jgi:histone deacetylase 4/5